jgi:hypothetical protein
MRVRDLLLLRAALAASALVGPLLGLLVGPLGGPLGSALRAQSPPDDEPSEWNAKLAFRREAGRDLVELRYRRDEHGLVEVGACEHGTMPFQPLFPRGALPRVAASWNTTNAALLLLTPADGSLLDDVDAERHLRRAGIEVAPVELRQFLLTPCASDDPVRARVDELDRAVALLHLRRRGHRGVLAECTALVARTDTPPVLRAHAAAALAANGKGAPTKAPHRLACENVSLPATADVYAMIDHARLPDLAPLRVLARQQALAASYRVVAALRAPTPDDLFFGQLVTDVVGEAAFEVVRRFGDARLEQSVLAIAQPVPLLPFGVALQAVGTFDAERAADAWQEIAKVPANRVRCTTANGTTSVHAAAGDVSFDATSLALCMRGVSVAPAPEVARALLADGPCVRVIVPGSSRLWRALDPELPAPERAELTVSFAPALRIALALDARDDAGALAWAAFGQREIAAAGASLDAAFADSRAGAHVRPVHDALAAVRFAATGARVDAVLAGDRTLWSEHFAALVALPGALALLR